MFSAVSEDYLYWYRAHVLEVYDGDTITVFVDRGFKEGFETKLRLYGIDTPEVRGVERPEGLIARDWLRGEILGEDVVIRSHKDKTEKWGRFLAEVFLDGRNLNKELLDRGLAVPMVY